MTSLTLLTALAMMVAAPSSPRVHCRDGSHVSAEEGCSVHGGMVKAHEKASPAQDAIAPTQRAEDRPAHESPYSAFGAPEAKTPGSQRHRRTGARLECKDGTIQTQGQRQGKFACDGHGGVKD
jgi:hypothetical protein